MDALVPRQVTAKTAPLVITKTTPAHVQVIYIPLLRSGVASYRSSHSGYFMQEAVITYWALVVVVLVR